MNFMFYNRPSLLNAINYHIWLNKLIYVAVVLGKAPNLFYYPFYILPSRLRLTSIDYIDTHSHPGRRPRRDGRDNERLLLYTLLTRLAHPFLSCPKGFTHTREIDI